MTEPNAEPGRSSGMTDPRWPSLAHPHLADTLETLHLWTQIVGKVKLASLPWLNESWHVPLYVSAAGLASGLVTYGALGFELTFDLLAGELRLASSEGRHASVPLEPTSVAAFYASVGAAMKQIGVELDLSPSPCEISDATPFADDHAQRVFVLEAARSYWLALIQVQQVFHRFRSRFIGKCSPIHFFWGSFDLAVTRFSGRPAPLAEHGAANTSLAVMQDAYAGEQASCGFWPGGVAGPSFYVEAWPVPPSFASAEVGPAEARFDGKLDEWVLGYDAVRGSADPDGALLTFLQSGYAAIADAGRWDRARLERDEGPIGYPPPLRRSTRG